MGLVLAVLVFGAVAASDEGSDVLCVSPPEVVGIEPAAAANLGGAIASTLRGQGVTARFSASAADDASCAPTGLGVVHIQILRAGSSMHLRLRAFGPDGTSEVTSVATQRPRTSEAIELDEELRQIVVALRAHRAAASPSPQPLEVAVASSPASPAPGFVTRFGVVPLALWATGTASLIVAGAFQLNAIHHHDALGNGNYDAERSGGIHSQNVARVTSVVGLAAIAAGVVVYLLRDDGPAITAGDADLVIARF